MVYRGSQNYDQDSFFEKYQQLRKRSESANDTLEKPIFFEMLDKASDSILDLGCGNAAFGVELLERGASFYTGLEGSKNMVDEAKKNVASPIENRQAEIIHTTLEDWEYPVEKYDMVVSRLVLHYIEDIHHLFSKVYQALKPSGSFIFSIEHPLMTSAHESLKAGGLKQDWIIDNYFYTGKREHAWLGIQVKKYHRTIEDYFSSMQEAGFVIESLRESKPQLENFSSKETYERRMRIPLFLFLKARKV
ncbi:class I SAM-dependent methyltransferase [Bacillus horti]|uniref:Cyclopropane fatty-acyl-phospholipid synthase-like methyltransferase n=1 Tax=Caldalkalibacillus horti TaxID=77523 RepID=A0ABT9W543_9BACI|nr:class I SAM-dependent methyltransferase [Bacillus horti]MDQ0168359.1 cyclopropane fatty-acyl-phospholipid synthase-like methyltransferase [Bacillus horti]